MKLVPDLPLDSDWATILRKARVMLDELSPRMQTELVLHALCPQGISPELMTDKIVFELRVRGLLKLDGLWTAPYTIPTEIGRVVIATILADAAEVEIEAAVREQDMLYAREIEGVVS